MDKIYGINFAPFAPSGSFGPKARGSLATMQERTGATHVIFTPPGLQDTAHSETIDFTGPGTMGDTELEDMIRYAQSLGLKVILKPTVNCRSGEWRAWINFFDKDVPPEPKWHNWFASHSAFQLHYAALAAKTGCVMFIAGCEMVMAQRREAEWRQLFSALRAVYDGPLSYNTDKYQEENVTWWDAVDVISSSGYYPMGDWPAQLDRIEAVVRQAGKPFFFAETGCMSTEGSAAIPNNWELEGGLDLAAHAAWYEDMFANTSARNWVGGYGLWDWPCQLASKAAAQADKGYNLYAKPAEPVVKQWFKGTQI